MQARANRRQLYILAVLTVATLLAWWWVQPENRLDVDQGLFRMDDLGQISRVELQSPAGVVKLAFDGARWRVNDRYDAESGMIRVLFATLQQAQPKRPVAQAQRDSIREEMSRTGVKVSLYAGDELRKEFLAGGNTGKTQAYFADMASGDVYVMAIPGYRVYVSGILEMGAHGWRDKFVFGFNWGNFKKLEARFPQEPVDNFAVELLTNYFGIREMPEADTAKINTFLDNVSLLTVEEFIPEPRLIDSLSRVRPKMEIVVTDIGNRTYRLWLFDPGRSREGYAILQDTDVALIDRRKIEAILRTKSFFRKK